MNSTPTPPVKKRKRVFMWFFLAVQVIFLVWIIAGGHSAATDTSHCGTLSAADCKSAAQAGAGIGIALIIVFWCVVDVILGITYLVVRLARRR
jgi:hypothetical protein